VREGRFREDLYYRLNIIKIDVPPLRERKADIPLLTDYFMDKYCRELELTDGLTIGPEMTELFLGYDWPGNVRELANVIQRLMVMEEWEEIAAQLARDPEGEGLGSDPVGHELEGGAGTQEIVPLKQIRAKAAGDIEKRLIARALKMTGGNKTRAAQILDISYKALLYKMDHLGLSLDSI
jgi:two-component system response regulator AtoC